MKYTTTTLITLCLAGCTAQNKPQPAALITDAHKAKLAPSIQQINMPSVDVDDNFGISVALDEDSAMIASESHDDHGCVYLFTKNKRGIWERNGLLKPPSQSHKEFGRLIKIHKNVALVASYVRTANNRLGHVNIYNKTSKGKWKFRQSLTPHVPHIEFGHSFDIDGDTIVVGAPGFDKTTPAKPDSIATSSPETGLAYVFKKTKTGTWAPTQRIEIPTQPGKHAEFGSAVALHHNTLAIGAPKATVKRAKQYTQKHKRRTFHHWMSVKRYNNPPAGAVFMYTRTKNNWQYTTKIQDKPAVKSGRFGSQLQLSQTHLAVGIPHLNAIRKRHGTIHLFKQEGDKWNKVNPPMAPQRARQGELFAHTIRLNRNQIVLSHPSYKTKTSQYGAIHVFDSQSSKTALQHTYQLKDVQVTPFGGVDIHNNTILTTGAKRHSTSNMANEQNDFFVALFLRQVGK